MRILTIAIIYLLFGHGLFAQQATVINWDRMEKILNPSNDTTYVINFWATWCVPCVKELPAFIKLADEYRDKKVKLILVSIDFKRQLDTRVKPFIAEHKIKDDVYLLDEPDYNSWIDKVDPSWNGSIPATLIINSGKSKRAFYEREFSFEELNEIVKPLIP